MKNKTHVLILFLILLVLPTSSVLACGNSSEKEKTEKTSCSIKDNHSIKKWCCDNDKKDVDGCTGACKNSSCHCISTVNISIFVNDFELLNTNNFTLLVNDWAYIQQIPKAVYLSIWQPPKIS